jgi:hypothetical protein
MLKMIISESERAHRVGHLVTDARCSEWVVILEKHKVQQWSILLVAGKKARARLGHPTAGGLMQRSPCTLGAPVGGELPTFSHRSTTLSPVYPWLMYLVPDSVQIGVSFGADREPSHDRGQSRADLKGAQFDARKL